MGISRLAANKRSRLELPNVIHAQTKGECFVERSSFKIANSKWFALFPRSSSVCNIVLARWNLLRRSMFCNKLNIKFAPPSTINSFAPSCFFRYTSSLFAENSFVGDSQFAIEWASNFSHVRVRCVIIGWANVANADVRWRLNCAKVVCFLPNFLWGCSDLWIFYSHWIFLIFSYLDINAKFWKWKQFYWAENFYCRFKRKDIHQVENIGNGWFLHFFSHIISRWREVGF